MPFLIISNNALMIDLEDALVPEVDISYDPGRASPVGDLITSAPLFNETAVVSAVEKDPSIKTHDSSSRSFRGSGEKKDSCM